MLQSLSHRIIHCIILVKHGQESCTFSLSFSLFVSLNFKHTKKHQNNPTRIRASNISFFHFSTDLMLPVLLSRLCVCVCEYTIYHIHSHYVKRKWDRPRADQTNTIFIVITMKWIWCKSQASWKKPTKNCGELVPKSIQFGVVCLHYIVNI